MRDNFRYYVGSKPDRHSLHGHVVSGPLGYLGVMQNVVCSRNVRRHVLVLDDCCGEGVYCDAKESAFVAWNAEYPF